MPATNGELQGRERRGLFPTNVTALISYGRNE
jgi:hypothetical protein